MLGFRLVIIMASHRPVFYGWSWDKGKGQAKHIAERAIVVHMVTSLGSATAEAKQ